MTLHKRLFLATILLMAGVASLTVFTANTSGPAADATGSPLSPYGNQGCRGCHGSGGSFNPNSGITITGLPTSYYPGNSYNLTLSLSNPTNKNGFQAIALGAGNVQAGSFTAGAGNKVQPIGGRGYIEHNSGSTTGSWNFTWTAPANNLGTITWYAAGNATNGNNSTSGDNIYTHTQTLPGLARISAMASVSSTTCPGGCDGQITVTPTGGAGPPYSILWSTGSTTSPITGLCGGTYIVTISDVAGNQEVDTFQIVGPTGSAVVSLAPALTEPPCTQTTGSIALNPSGGALPYTFQWAGPGNVSSVTTSTANNLGIGSYSVTVTDGNMCSIDTTIQLNAISSGLSAMFNTRDANCAQSDGLARVMPSGGVGPYAYLWSFNNATDDSIGGVPAGTYTVTVTDTNGCSDSFSVQVNNLNGPNMQVTQVDSIICYGDSNGTITLNITGGTAPYSFTWSPAIGADSVATGLTAGTYQVTVTDANNCETSLSVPLGQPSAPFSVMATTTSDTNNNCIGAINLQVSGNNTTSGLMVQWGPPISSQGTVINGLCGGTYAATVTDGAGCDTVISVEIGNVITNSITDREASAGWRIYPNPAREMVRLEWQGDALNALRIRAFNATGQEVFRAVPQGLSANVQEIQVSDWPQGLYWIVLESNGTKDIQRIIVQR